MRFPGFVGPSYQSRSVNFDCQRLINFYPELNELGTGKEQEKYVLLGTPGLELLVTLPKSPVRGVYMSTKGRLFAVGGDTLYEISSAWVATSRGTLLTSSGTVSMKDNGLHLCVVDNPNGYFMEFATNTFAQISDTDFTSIGASQVTCIDGYFIFIKPDSGQFFISGLNDITFDALDIATSEGSPDNIVAIVAVQRDLWIFNAQTTEIFYDSGNTDFPFERAQGAFIEFGCGAQFSAVKVANSVMWLGQDDKGANVIYRATSYQPQRVSTHPLEAAIAGYGDISTAVAWTYQDGGHDFYVINFPSVSTTWVFDCTTGFWHERCYLNNGELERHRADNHAFAFSTHVVGDYSNGKIYSLSSSVYDDDGVEILSRRRAPHATSGGNRVNHDRFQLDIEAGVGLDGSGNGTDPQVMLRWSDDGGHTWSNEKWTSIGKIGQFKNRAIWRRLGMSRDRVYEITITDKVKKVVLGAWLDAEPGGS